MSGSVDSHFHWFPRAHFERMISRTSLPRVERNGEGYNYLYDGGLLPMWPAWFELEEGLAESRAATGDDMSVISTTGVMAGLFDMVPLAEGVDLAADWNQTMADEQRRRPGVFYGTAAIPLVETSAALEVLEAAIGELGLVGVNLPAITADGPIDQDRLDPFYARVAELGVPLIVHPTDFVFNDVLTGYDNGIMRSMGRLLDSSVTVMRLIFSGIMERHPDLRVVQTHAGGILPFQAGRLDKNARIAGLPEKPSTYLKRMSVDTVAPQALTIRAALEFYGEDRVLYGTDFPCWHPADARGVIDEIALPAEQDAKLMGGNAARLFRLPQHVGA